MKAVITAGGEGKRLRPLTCTVPKAAVRLLGKSLIEYTLDFLSSNGVDEVVITGNYLEDEIERCVFPRKNRKMGITFIKEEAILGEASSVKNAAKDFDETFLVISGDVFCELSLKNAIDYHIHTNAQATVVNVINENKENSVKAPGIFIIEPEFLNLIDTASSYDLSEITELLSRKSTSIKRFEEKGVFFNIDSISSYRNCQEYMLKNMTFENNLAENIIVKSTLPKGNYTIEPPVYIGENVTIGDDAVIGPLSVIDDNAMIGENAKIRNSVMLENSNASAFSKLYKAVLCPDCTVRKSSRIFENCVIGSGAVIGENCVVCDGVLVWPQKNAESNMTLRRNLRYGTGKRQIFDDYGIGTDEKLDAEKCAAIGCAIGSTFCTKKVAVACDGNELSKAMLNCLLGGLASSGCQAWNFGDSFFSQLSFFTSFCSLPIGVFLECHADEIRIRLCSEGGLSLPKNIEARIEQRYVLKEFKSAQSKEIRSAADMTSVNMMYRRELLRQCETSLSGISVMPVIENEKISMLFDDCINKLDGKIGNGITINISFDGVRLSVIENNIDYPFHKILALLCMHEAKKGNDIAVPFDAPQVIASVAGVYERKVFRYSDSPCDENETQAIMLAKKQIWCRDGLFMAVKLLSLMREYSCSLKELCADLPDFYIENKVLKVNFPLSVLDTVFELDSKGTEHIKDGWLLRKNGVRTLIIPSKTGRKLRILSESFNSETASEMCREITRCIQSISLDNISK